MEQTSMPLATQKTSETGASPRQPSFIVGVMFFLAILDIIYWIIWLGGGRAWLATSSQPSYFVYENAFPLADAWIAVTLMLGALGILRKQPWGLLFSLLAGGAGVYLGCVDLLFDLENRIYFVPRGTDPSTVLIEIGVNILSLGMSIFLIPYFWRKRTSLFGLQAQG